tara:strand:- start:45490 stop:45927 length:438 start_codon:yes stop_codon:yes gene_type:complete
MKHVKLFEQFITEKKIQIKRRYTEKYPSKTISSNAKVRSVVLDAIKDGIITSDELKTILKEVGANNRWLSRNKKLFNISEEGGVSSYKLSPYANKILKALMIEDVQLNPNMNIQGMGDTKFPEGDNVGSGDIPFDLNSEDEDEEE